LENNNTPTDFTRATKELTASIDNLVEILKNNEVQSRLAHEGKRIDYDALKSVIKSVINASKEQK
jgi:hypothetical protein